MEPKPTQCDKILKALRDAKGEYVNGRTFLRDLYISQYHARIYELQAKGHQIEASKEKDSFGFCSYKLIEQPEQMKMDTDTFDPENYPEKMI